MRKLLAFIFCFYQFCFFIQASDNEIFSKGAEEFFMRHGKNIALFHPKAWKGMKAPRSLIFLINNFVYNDDSLDTDVLSGLIADMAELCMKAYVMRAMQVMYFYEALEALIDHVRNINIHYMRISEKLDQGNCWHKETVDMVYKWNYSAEKIAIPIMMCAMSLITDEEELAYSFDPKEQINNFGKQCSTILKELEKKKKELIKTNKSFFVLKVGLFGALYKFFNHVSQKTERLFNQTAPFTFKYYYYEALVAHKIYSFMVISRFYLPGEIGEIVAKNLFGGSFIAEMKEMVKKAAQSITG